MAGDTPITIVGNAVDDVDLRFTPSGAAVAKFRIASTPRFYDKQSQAFKDGEPLFLQVECWQQMAEHVAETVEKGMRLIVHGVLKPNNYETREGEKRFGYKIAAEEIGPSLKFATAKLQKMTRSNGGGQASGGGADDPWAGGAPASAGARTGGGFDDSPPF